MRKPIPSASILALLPIAVRTRLEELVASLNKAAPANVEAIIAFGSVVRGGFDAARSDVDVVLFVKNDAPEQLEVMAPALRLARAAARIEVVILLTSELGRGADVFPLWFEDMRGCHSVLWGRDVFSDLVVHDEHKRLRIEQELRDARIRLRAALVGEPDDAMLALTLTRMTHQLRSPLHALLVLQGGRVPDDLDAVLRAAGEAWHADPTALIAPKRDARAALKALRRLLDEAIADVDSLALPIGGAS